MSYTDAFGMKVTYGRDEAVDSNGLVTVTHFGAVHQLVLDIDYDRDGLPSVADLSIRNAKVPAGAAIMGAKLVVLKAAADATVTTDIGLVKKDGTTAIDADGLVDGATLAAGVKTGAGALIGAVNGNDDGYVVMTAAGAAAAATAAELKGLKALLIVDYV